MENFVVLAVVAVIVGCAVWYIRREKKRGVKCVGCPHAGKCAHSHNGGCPSQMQ